MASKREIAGPTPHGGVRAELYIDEAEGTVEIAEFDVADNVVYRTYGTIPTVDNKSYFAECPRDDKGHCTTSGALSGPPKVPNSTVTFASEDAKTVAKNIFGKDVTPGQLAAAGNAIDGGKSKVERSPNGAVLTINTVNPGGDAVRAFYQDRNGKIVCANKTFENDSKKGGSKERGADILANQVKQLRELGVDRIETHAAGPERGTAPNGEPWVGYKVWPKLGYDGQIPDKLWKKLPPEIRKAAGETSGVLGIGGKPGNRSVLHLYSLPGGPEAWAKHGGSMDMTFDLKDGSPSMKTLEKYLASRPSTPASNEAVAMVHNEERDKARDRFAELTGILLELELEGKTDPELQAEYEELQKQFQEEPGEE